MAAAGLPQKSPQRPGAELSEILPPLTGGPCLLYTSTFFQNASHELRTPLMSISGYAQGIQCGVFEDVAQAASVILDESTRLTEGRKYNQPCMVCFLRTLIMEPTEDCMPNW